MRTECRGIRDIASLLCDIFGSNFGLGINCTERKKYEETEKEYKKCGMRHTETQTNIRDNTAVKEKNAKEEKELERKKKGSSLALDSLCNRVKLKQMLRSRTLIAGG